MITGQNICMRVHVKHTCVHDVSNVNWRSFQRRRNIQRVLYTFENGPTARFWLTLEHSNHPVISGGLVSVLRWENRRNKRKHIRGEWCLPFFFCWSQIHSPGCIAYNIIYCRLLLGLKSPLTRRKSGDNSIISVSGSSCGVTGWSIWVKPSADANEAAHG